MVREKSEEEIEGREIEENKRWRYREVTEMGVVRNTEEEKWEEMEKKHDQESWKETHRGRGDLGWGRMDEWTKDIWHRKMGEKN